MSATGANGWCGVVWPVAGGLRRRDGDCRWRGRQRRSDPDMGRGLPPALFCGRHVRQKVELTLAVDEDRDQRLAVLGEQDALPPLLGAQPNPERKADHPIAHNDAAIVVDHEIGRYASGRPARVFDTSL